MCLSEVLMEDLGVRAALLSSLLTMKCMILGIWSEYRSSGRRPVPGVEGIIGGVEMEIRV